MIAENGVVEDTTHDCPLWGGMCGGWEGGGGAGGAGMGCLSILLKKWGKKPRLLLETSTVSTKQPFLFSLFPVVVVFLFACFSVCLCFKASLQFVLSHKQNLLQGKFPETLHV